MFNGTPGSFAAPWSPMGLVYPNLTPPSAYFTVSLKTSQLQAVQRNND